MTIVGHKHRFEIPKYTVHISTPYVTDGMATINFGKYAKYFNKDAWYNKMLKTQL